MAGGFKGVVEDQAFEFSGLLFGLHGRGDGVDGGVEDLSDQVGWVELGFRFLDCLPGRARYEHRHFDEVAVLVGWKVSRRDGAVELGLWLRFVRQLVMVGWVGHRRVFLRRAMVRVAAAILRAAWVGLADLRRAL